MNEQFIRRAKLIVLAVPPILEPLEVVGPAEQQSTLVEVISFLDFRVSFTIKKTSESTINTSKISIYNLKKESRALLEKENLKVILQVGYTGFLGSNSREITEKEPVLKTLFVGDVAAVRSTRKGPDIVSEIEAGDGEKNVVQSYINRTFEGGATASDNTFKDGTAIKVILKALIKELGYIPNATKEKRIDELLKIVSDRKINRSITLSGPVKHYLDSILKDEGLEWSVQDDEFYIADPDAQTSTMAASVVLNSKSGLLDIAKGKEGLINFKALLNPQINPTSIITVNSELVDLANSNFKVRKVDYTGDTHGGNWLAIGEAVPIG